MGRIQAIPIYRVLPYPVISLSSKLRVVYVCSCVCIFVNPPACTGRVIFSRTVATTETKRGYVGKYHRCSRLTETGVPFPRVVCGQVEHVRMLLGTIQYHRCSRLTETGVLFPRVVCGQVEHVRMLLGTIQYVLLCEGCTLEECSLATDLVCVTFVFCGIQQIFPLSLCQWNKTSVTKVRCPE